MRGWGLLNKSYDTDKMATKERDQSETQIKVERMRQ